MCGFVELDSLSPPRFVSGGLLVSRENTNNDSRRSRGAAGGRIMWEEDAVTTSDLPVGRNGAESRLVLCQLLTKAARYSLPVLHTNHSLIQLVTSGLNEKL